MIESNISNGISIILYFIGDITSLLILIPLIIFAWLALRSRSVKSFQFQIMVFIFMYFVGQIIENNNNNRILIFSTLPTDIGTQIHVIAALFFVVMMLFRFYYAESKNKNNLIDDTRDNAK